MRREYEEEQERKRSKEKAVSAVAGNSFCRAHGDAFSNFLLCHSAKTCKSGCVISCPGNEFMQPGIHRFAEYSAEVIMKNS